MADKQQLDLLRRGVRDWNIWRKQHPGIRPNLRNADLRNADLSEANLGEANLIFAHLLEANLGGALQLHLFGESLPQGAFAEELVSL